MAMEEMAVPGARERDQVRAWTANRDAEIQKARMDWKEIQDGIKRVEHELANAKQVYADAWHKGDGLTVAEATDAMNDARSSLSALRAGADDLKERFGGQWTFEEMIGSIRPRPGEEQFLREHPDLLLDQGKRQRLQVYAQDAINQGLERGTPEFVEFVADKMNYGKPKQPESWAPSRGQNNNGNGERRSRSGLTEKQLEILPYTGATQEEYARGVKRLMEEKRQGMHPGGY